MAEFTTEEVENIITAFKEMGVKPKADTAEDLKQWMAGFVHHTGSVPIKTEPAASVTPPPADPSTVQFPSTVTISHPPRLPIFSGDGKGEVTFDQWRYEVECLVSGNYSAEAIGLAIRRSLRGEAGRIPLRLGPTATTTTLLTKMESVYGQVDQREMILANFYSARQLDTEDVSNWGCRLEDLLNKAITKGQVKASDANDMLRAMFWSGLKQQWKDITGHLYDRIADFDELRVAIRRIEQDHRKAELTKPRSSLPSKSAVSTTSSLDDLTGIVQQLSADVKKLREECRRPRFVNERRTPTGSHADLFENRPASDRSRDQWRQPNRQPANQGDRTQFHDWRRPEGESRKESDRTSERYSEAVCWRCGQAGHIQKGCRIRTDHLRKPLNERKPAGRGGQ